MHGKVVLLLLAVYCSLTTKVSCLVLIFRVLCEESMGFRGKPCVEGGFSEPISSDIYKVIHNVLTWRKNVLRQNKEKSDEI